MSEQALNLQNDWQEVKKQFRNHFKDNNLQISEEKVKYSKSGEYLEINRDGTASGGMPLHRNDMKNIKEIEILKSEIKLFSEDSEYTFRR